MVEWIEPFNAFYSKDIIENIEKHLSQDRRSINSYCLKLKVHYIEEEEAREFSPNWDMFLKFKYKRGIKQLFKDA